ncbi:MAG: type I methionyl aminopeptidase [Candidatus Omnitrophota bacterium]
MTVLTSNADIRKIREAGKVVRDILAYAKELVREGVSTAFLDSEIEKKIAEKSGEPAFKGYKGYPSAICASVNSVVVHGIPSGKIVLREGDIVSIDVGIKKNGFYTDAAATFAVGKVDRKTARLMKITEKSLYEGIEEAVAGNRVGDISNAIQSIVEKNGYQEVRAFVGHGIGKELHEFPEVPNFGERGRGPRLKEGMILAIEPMVNTGTREIKVLEDGWTAVTEDGKLSAHFEHTVIVGKEKAEILT